MANQTPRSPRSRAASTSSFSARAAASTTPPETATPVTAGEKAPQPARRRTPRKTTPRRSAAPARPRSTLAIDIGGTGLKAAVLDEGGQMEQDRVRIPTPYPMSPQKLVTVLVDMVKPLPAFDRVSAGFPGMVRSGRILSAPHFISPDGPGGTPVPKLARAWEGFDLESELAQATGKPTKVANDADLQGAAVVEGKGLEVVVTLGTGVGTAFFFEGRLLPHLEFAHTPFRKGATYNEELGEAARCSIGNKKWQKRVLEAIETFHALTFFDHCYIGGGNSSRITVDLPENVSLVDNRAGILGGIKLWERA
jgi:polyphosphate glucokinase